MSEGLEGIGCVKPKGNGSGICLSTRPVSFITKPEVEVYQLMNSARSVLYGKHERSKKRLKAAAVDVPKSITSTSTWLQQAFY